MTPDRRSRILEVLQRRQTDLAMVIDNIHDPHNVGAILRSCDAFGILDVHLCYTYQQMPKFSEIRSTSAASAVKWLRITKWDSAAVLIKHLKEEGKQILTTQVSDRALPPAELDLIQPTALVLGNEHQGVSGEWMEVADQNVVIPMMGMVESLNVSVAASVMLYEAFRQRNVRGRYQMPFKGESAWMKTWLEE